MRSLFNFTGKQVAQAADVSLSSVKRYKAGQVFSERSKKNFDIEGKIEKGLRKLLKKEQQKLKKEIWKRYNDIKQVMRWEGMEGTNITSPAWDFFEKHGGLDLLTARGKTLEQIEDDINFVKLFLEKRTASGEGFKKWLKALKDNAEKLTGSDEKQYQEDFFEVFKMLKDEGVKYYKDGVFQSEQAADDINIAFAEFREQGIPFDSIKIYEFLINDRTIEYEKQQAIQQALDDEALFYKE